MQNKLKGWITPNSITKDPYDKILTSDATGNAWFKDLYKERTEVTLKTPRSILLLVYTRIKNSSDEDNHPVIIIT